MFHVLFKGFAGAELYHFKRTDSACISFFCMAGRVYGVAPLFSSLEFGVS